MTAYVFACDDCGVVSPPILPRHAATVRNAHDCGRVCVDCGWRTALSCTAYRGRCKACYSEIPHRPLRRGADLIEDAEWLADHGADLADVLARLDVKKDTFWQAMKRAERLDLYWRLADRMPDADLRRASSKNRSVA